MELKDFETLMREITPKLRKLMPKELNWVLVVDDPRSTCRGFLSNAPSSDEVVAFLALTLHSLNEAGNTIEGKIEPNEDKVH